MLLRFNARSEKSLVNIEIPMEYVCHFSLLFSKMQLNSILNEKAELYAFLSRTSFNPDALNTINAKLQTHSPKNRIHGYSFPNYLYSHTTQ